MKRTMMSRGLAVVVVCGLAAAVWSLFAPHRSQSGGPLTLEQARKSCPVALPDGAANVQYATYRHWQAYSEYVRFEAPAATCLAHLKTLTGQDPPAPARVDAAGLAGPSIGFDNGLPWWDVQKVEHGVGVGGGPSVSKVIVDTDRGVFYYTKTD